VPYGGEVAKPMQDMRFDVPVVGLKTIETMSRATRELSSSGRGAMSSWTAKAMTRAANDAGIAVCAE